MAPCAEADFVAPLRLLAEGGILTLLGEPPAQVLLDLTLVVAPGEGVAGLARILGLLELLSRDLEEPLLLALAVELLLALPGVLPQEPLEDPVDQRAAIHCGDGDRLLGLIDRLGSEHGAKEELLRAVRIGVDAGDAQAP